jgi:hypothetical protein
MVSLHAWTNGDLWLLHATLGNPAMMELLGGIAGFINRGEHTFEYPKGHWMRCNDWRIDLFANY